MSERENVKDYEDIIHLSRPVSKKHPPMDRMSRAAQFSSFAALTGYEDSVRRKQGEVEERVIKNRGMEEIQEFWE